MSPTRPRAGAAMPQRPQIADGGRHDPTPGDRRGGSASSSGSTPTLMRISSSSRRTTPRTRNDRPLIRPNSTSPRAPHPRRTWSGSADEAPVSLCPNQFRARATSRTVDNVERFARSGPTSTGPTSTRPNSIFLPDLSPTLVVQSSPGHFHLYWLVEDFPLAAFKAAQLKLAELTGGDMGVAKNAAQGVLRLPGYFHQKGEPFRTFVRSNPSATLATLSWPVHPGATRCIRGILPTR